MPIQLKHRTWHFVNLMSIVVIACHQKDLSAKTQKSKSINQIANYPFTLKKPTKFSLPIQLCNAVMFAYNNAGKEKATFRDEYMVICNNKIEFSRWLYEKLQNVYRNSNPLGDGEREHALTQVIKRDLYVGGKLENVEAFLVNEQAQIKIHEEAKYYIDLLIQWEPASSPKE